MLSGEGMGSSAQIDAFFDEATNSVSYLVSDPATGVAAIIDPVLDFDAASGVVATRSADRILAAAGEQGLRIEWVLETHVHADHLSAAALIRERSGAKIGVGSGIRDVQAVFGPMLGAGDLGDGDFDQLFDDGDTIPLGGLTIE